MPTFQVNYKYVAANGKLRNAGTIEDAKTAAEAVKAAIPKIKAEHDKFVITSTLQWKDQ